LFLLVLRLRGIAEHTRKNRFVIVWELLGHGLLEMSREMTYLQATQVLKLLSSNTSKSYPQATHPCCIKRGMLAISIRRIDRSGGSATLCDVGIDYLCYCAGPARWLGVFLLLVWLTYSYLRPCLWCKAQFDLWWDSFRVKHQAPNSGQTNLISQETSDKQCRISSYSSAPNQDYR
jgi:hypothetical protein